MMDQPNIIFCFADDQRFDTIAALGHPHVKTPNLDRLVNQGTTFTQAHIPGGSCGAVCMPSRAMLHTGQSLFHIDGIGQSIPESTPLLGELLQQAGYQTFGSGKWHNGRESYHRSFTDGDEIFFGGMADHWNVPAYHFDPTGKYDATCPIIMDPMQTNTVLQRECDHINSGMHSSTMIADAGIEFLRNGRSDKPFFAYLSFLAPHDPRTMPQEFLDMYDPESIPLPPNFMEEHPFDNGVLQIRDETLAAQPRQPDEVRRHIAEYYAMISHLDYEIGRVIHELEVQGLANNTVIVFAADNGLAVGQHGLFGKQNCYDHSLRVPMVIAGPGINYAREETPVMHYDLFPTICELAGVTPPDGDGSSLVPALKGETLTNRECLYFAYTHLQRAIRHGAYKLIEYAVEGEPRRTQLFNLKNDPWETNNLADDPAYADQIESLSTELRRQRDLQGDSYDWGKAFWERGS